MQFKYMYTVYTAEILVCNSLTQFFFNLIFNLSQGNQFKSTVTYYKFKIDVVGKSNVTDKNYSALLHSLW